MALAPNPPICLTDLRTEFGDANGGNVCLTEYYAGGANVPSNTSGTNGAVPTSGTVCLTDFLGTANVAATTYDSSLSESEYSMDTNIIIRPQLRIQYASGNINVNWYPDSENPSPSEGTLVYQIVNPASGYTVRDSHTETGDGPNNWTYSNIQPNGSAVSIPTSTFFTDWQPEFESGGSYDQEGTNFSTLTVSLIFEKSGETTFTYNFTLDVEIETAGEGGL
jgi:hypothetical protein